MMYFAYALRTLLRLLLRRPILGVCVIPVMADGRVVLVRRRDSGRWSLPGGLMDWGEDVITTATRELKEEAGVDTVGLRRLVGVYSQPGRDPRFHSVCVAVVLYVQGTPDAVDCREVLEAKGFAMADVPWENLDHDHKQHLKDYLDYKTVVY